MRTKQVTCLTLLICFVGFSWGDRCVGQNIQIFDDDPLTLMVRDIHRSQSSVRILPQDDIWFVDGRQSHLYPGDLSALRIRRLVQGNWIEDQLETLVSQHAQDKSKATMIYIHGNRTDEDWAHSRGLQVYDTLFSDNGNCRPPVRFVIFAWRSEREIVRALRDYESKSNRAARVGQTAAHFVAHFHDRNLVVAGFSLGVQVALSAMNQPEIQQAHHDHELTGQYRVCMIAPALDGCYACELARQHPNGHAVARADIFTNHTDCALRVSKRVRRRQCPDGDISMAELAARGNLPLSRISVCDVAGEVGKSHSVVKYMKVRQIHASLNQMIEEVFHASTPEVIDHPPID